MLCQPLHLSSPLPISRHCPFPLCGIRDPAAEKGQGQQVGKEKPYLPGFEPTVSAAPDCGHSNGPSPLASCSAPAPSPVSSALHHSARREESSPRATAGRRQRGTNTKAEIAKVGEGSWTVTVDVIRTVPSPHGKLTRPMRIYIRSSLGTRPVCSVQQDWISGCARYTLPDLAESASGADAGLVGLLRHCPL